MKLRRAVEFRLFQIAVCQWIKNLLLVLRWSWRFRLNIWFLRSGGFSFIKSLLADFEGSVFTNLLINVRCEFPISLYTFGYTRAGVRTASLMRARACASLIEMRIVNRNEVGLMFRELFAPRSAGSYAAGRVQEKRSGTHSRLTSPDFYGRVVCWKL
jgi:hypothetical protein